jgi:hypothetical protein
MINVSNKYIDVDSEPNYCDIDPLSKDTVDEHLISIRVLNDAGIQTVGSDDKGMDVLFVMYVCQFVWYLLQLQLYMLF